MKRRFILTVLAATGMSSGCVAQDMATRGDWRFAGDGDTGVYGWDIGSLRQTNGEAFVQVLAAPLQPASGPSGQDFEIWSVHVFCASHTWRIERLQGFRSDGSPISAITPPPAPRSILYRVADSPPDSFFPNVCEGRRLPPAQAAGEAADAAHQFRSYVVSGTAEWVRSGRPGAPQQAH